MYACVSIENGRVSRGTIHFERYTQSTRSSHSDTVHARGMIPVENNKDAIPHEGVCTEEEAGFEKPPSIRNSDDAIMLTTMQAKTIYKSLSRQVTLNYEPLYYPGRR